MPATIVYDRTKTVVRRHVVPGPAVPLHPQAAAFVAHTGSPPTSSLLLAVSQIFPAGIRVSAGGLSYNIPQSVLRGTAPLVAVTFNELFGSSLAFFAYIVLAALVTLVIILTAGRRWVNDFAEHSGDVGARTDEKGERHDHAHHTVTAVPSPHRGCRRLSGHGSVGQAW